MDISLTGTLRNDQTAGLQDDDDAISGTLSGLLARFANFLNGTAAGSDPNIPGTLALDATQLAYADSVEGVITSSLSLTVDAEGSDVDDLFFSDGTGQLLDGDQVFISAGVPLKTLSGSNVYFHSYDDGNIVLATTSATSGAGDVVAAFYLNESPDHLSASIQMVTFMALDHPVDTNADDSINWTNLLNVSASGSISFDFDQLKSGSSLWCAVGTQTAGLLVTGGNPQEDSSHKKTNTSDVIHTSQGGEGATIGVNNQLFDVAGESAVFTLVTGFTNLAGTDSGATGDYTIDPKPNDNKPEGIDYSGYINTTGAGIFISQSQGSPAQAKDFDIYLLSAGGGTTAEDGANYIPGLASDAAVDAETVTVVDENGVPVGTWALSPSGTQFANGSTHDGVTITITGNKIDVNGVFGEYTISWTTDGVDTFNRFELVSQAGQFDVGRVDVDNVTGDTQAVGGSMFVDDDGPVIGDSAGGTAIANSTVHLTTGATSGNVGLGDLPGTDGQNSLQITSFTASVTLLTGITLEGVINTDKTEVKYFQDLNNNDILDGNDVHWYTMSITQNATSADFYNFTVVNAPAPPPLIFKFDGLPSGQNLFGAVASSLSGPGLIFFGRDADLKANGEFTNTSDTINSSQGGIFGATIGINNQMFDSPEGCYFTYVKDIADSFIANVPNGLDQNEADDADNLDYAGGLNPTLSAFLGISQTQGNAVEEMKITAFHIDSAFQEDAMVDNAGGDGDDVIEITRVYVTDQFGVELEDTDGSSNSSTISVDLSGLTAVVTGLEAGYIVHWVTASEHNQVLVEDTVGKFDIGLFGLDQPQTFPDHTLNFQATLKDGDLDTAVAGWSVTVDAAPFI